jgi:aldehyde dehydrogenase (NAD+)
MTPTLTELYDTVPWGPAPESDKPAQAWLDAHKRAFGHFIGGAFTKPAKGLDVLNPATGGVLAKVTQGSPRTRKAPVCACPHDPAQRAAAGGAGVARQRQEHP